MGREWDYSRSTDPDNKVLLHVGWIVIGLLLIFFLSEIGIMLWIIGHIMIANMKMENES